MKKEIIQYSAMKYGVILCFIAIVGITFLINACNKPGKQTTPVNQANEAVANNAPAPVVQKNSLTQVVTVGDVRKSDDGSYTRIIFNENEEIFTTTDQAVISQLQDALNSKKTVKATYNPWTGTVLAVNDATADEAARLNSRQIVNSPGIQQKIDLSSNINDEVINNVLNNTSSIAALNTTTPGLTDVIPDLATAQAMFDYISRQDCELGAPYMIDYCIPFQYCEDGCYARAHKMCWILNNTYHYATHKIFSFANAGSDQLSVKCEKWRGCCVNWWYHVAPLVNIKTTTGVKAYVFDPAMFDQPVLLATWLHYQQNPACVTGGSVAHVSMTNIQPTSSYAPSGMSGLVFSTDPTYSSTNSTLSGYASLHTCY